MLRQGPHLVVLLLLVPGLTLEFAPPPPCGTRLRAAGACSELRLQPGSAGGADLDQVAVEAIVEALQGASASDKVVTKRLRQLGRSINNQQRATLARRVLGVSVLRRRLAFIVDTIDGLATNRAGDGDSDLGNVDERRAADLLAVYVLHHEGEVLGSGAEGGGGGGGRGAQVKFDQVKFVSAARAQMLAEVDLDQVWEPLRMDVQSVFESLSIRYSLPSWLLPRFAPQISQKVNVDEETLKIVSELAHLASSFNIIPPVYLRANPLWLPRSENSDEKARTALLDALQRSGVAARVAPLTPLGVQLINGRTPTGLQTDEWRNGLFEVQDIGSQVVAQATEASSGEIVIDFCAGNGGKTLALAAMVRNEGLVLAHDVSLLRLKQIIGSLERAHVHTDCVQVCAHGLRAGHLCAIFRRRLKRNGQKSGRSLNRRMAPWVGVRDTRV